MNPTKTNLLQRFLNDQKAVFLGLLLLALVIRLFGIISRPIWYDESFSILFSEKGPAAMMAGTLPAAGAAAEEHPLAYYTMLWLWMKVFGESLIAVRILSIAAGLGTVCAIYLLARELFDVKTAQVAGLFMALSPFQVHYSQEIRMYVFLAFWLTLATYAYWRAAQSRHWFWWIGFAIFAALAQYTHNLAAFYLIALALWPLITRDWRNLKAVTFAGFLAIILYLPWLIHIPAQFAKVDQAYWIARPGLYRLFTLLLYFVTNLPLPDAWLIVGLFISLFTIVIALWQTVRVARQHQADTRPGLWMLYLTFTPPILLFLFSQWRPIYLERALLPSGTVLFIWLAWALTKTRLPRPMQLTTFVLLLAGFGMGIYEHITYIGFPYGPYQTMTTNLQTNQQPGDVIIHSSKLSMMPSVYYDRNLAQTYVSDPPGSNVDTLAPATQKVLGLEAQPNIESAAGNANRVWFIIFDESNQEYIQAGYSMHPQLAWLMQHYSQVEVKKWDDLRVYLFAKNP